MQQPSTMQGKNLDSPDETREFENGKMDMVNLGEVTVGKIRDFGDAPRTDLL